MVQPSQNVRGSHEYYICEPLHCKRGVGAVHGAQLCLTSLLPQKDLVAE